MTDCEIRRYPGGATIEDAHTVRRIVFIEEQGVSEAEEMDGRDKQSIHVVAYEAKTGDPIGTARLRMPESDTGKVERVAVLEQYRNRGIGRGLMDAVEDEAHRQGCSRVTLHAQTAVEEFYHRLDYRTVSDEFEEAGIPHVKMEKDL